MSFPESKYADAADFARAYFSAYNKAVNNADLDKLNLAARILINTYAEGGTVYSCGNGGSAAIANHLGCDHCKLVQSDTNLHPRVVSLASTVEMLTAIGNDLSYDEVFIYQLRSLAKPGDTLITISSSGDSENIVRAASWAKDNGVRVISMTGFKGGRSAEIADVNLHIDADNYGVIEDSHQALMHILAQYIRQSHMEESLINQRKF